MDTIFALSSGRPPAAIAVVRVSGSEAQAAAVTLAGRLPPPRQAMLRTLRDGHGATLDRALVLSFPGPRSATGEDLVEFHLHGGPAVVNAVLAALAVLPECRLAQPGEFTRRALENGQVDLAQAEGLADLLAAESQDARRAALAATEGALSRQVRSWLDRLSGIAARLEGAIDYAEEAEVERETLRQVQALTAALTHELQAVLLQPSVERLRDGALIVLAGPPNAGKSSLFNALLQRDAAIVSPISGTTRDVIEAHVQRSGTAYRVVDTAGLTDTIDPVEQIGVDRARKLLEHADTILWLGAKEDMPERGILVRAKADLGALDSLGDASIPVSIYDPQSIATLWNVLEDRHRSSPAWNGLAFSDGQRSAIASASEHLFRALANEDEVLVAEHVRVAHASLAEIVGVAPTEAMLDALFSRFCLGK